jgi:hypothetical protein
VTDTGLVSVFYRQITTFPATLVEEAVYSPLYVFGAIVKNKVDIAVWIHLFDIFLSF